MAGSVAARLALCAVGLAFAVAWLYRRRARLAAECRGRVECSRAGAAARAGDEAGEDEAELVELRLRVTEGPGKGEAEEIVRVQPDSVDLMAHTCLVALPEDLRACAGRVAAQSNSSNATLCDNCSKALQKPLVCARCKTATYCSKDCQVHTAHRKCGSLAIKAVID